MLHYLRDILSTLLGYLKADWYILLIGILFAVTIRVYADADKLKHFFRRKAGISIPGAVTAGTLTPLCACGTMAVLLSMFVSSMPWGTVMAFLISSPLTSPSEYLFETAFLGNRFATGLLVTSVLLGLLAGIAAHFLEKRTRFFKDQFRLAAQTDESLYCGCSTANEAAADEDSGLEDEIALCCNSRLPGQGCCGKAKTDCCGNSSFLRKYKLDQLLKELWNTGVKKILLYFAIFITAGRIIELLLPTEWILLLFGNSKAYSIPLASTLGLPLYLTDSSALPLLKSFINSGAGEGAVLAFMIAGKATGMPVIAGMATFLKKRALLFYIGFIYFGSMLAGYLYQLISTVMH